MAPSGSSTEHEDTFAIQPDTSAAEAALRAKLSRKRTKTGCLTCRKRRIKCGEERPVCRNCIKSKRSCEGYNQRVVFKPSFDFRVLSHGAAHIPFPPGQLPVQASSWPLEHAQASSGPTYHAHPPDHNTFVQQEQQQQQQHELHFQTPLYIVPETQSQTFSQHPTAYLVPPHTPQLYQFQAGTIPYHGLPIYPAYPPVATQQFTFPDPAGSASHVGQPYMQTEWHAQPSVKVDTTSPLNRVPNSRTSPSSSQSSSTLAGTQVSAVESSATPWTANGYVPRPELSRPIDYRPPAPTHQPLQGYDQRFPGPYHHDEAPPDLYEHEAHSDPITTPTHFLREAAVETHDIDYWDVQSDEEIETETALLAPADSGRHRSFQRIITANNISIQDPQTRRYDTFIHPGILKRYEPDEVANPLQNEATARLFLHFIAVTGPSLSIYERQVRNTSMLFSDHDIQFSQQGLWTYTMPLAALRNRGLLHAMLALASLHVARLTNASDTPSYQHYAWALKRIHKSVSTEKQRYKLTTIAATMLLGFYEILTADHVKWNTHLFGSKQLFIETDFSTMTKQFRRLKVERAGRRKGKRKFSLQPHKIAQDTILDQIHDVDERLVSEISGQEVNYDGHGQILTPAASIPPELDLSKFEILRDLYWWYLKQDAYQSIISGNPLMLNYNRWTDCPPRAPLGKADAVYGTFDHLILLLGRIADFAARDRSRKLKVMEANGGQWRPAGAMKMPGPPQGAPPTPVSASTAQQPNGASFAGPQMRPGNAPQGPQFFGMAPPPRQNVRMPTSYQSLNNLPTPDPASPHDPIDLHMATQAALEEYGRIRAALHTLTSNLGEPFKPLTPEFQPPLDTPFGKALFYRSYDIGCLWAIYHMAMIIAIRSHPHMHPAAHVAAAISAEETRFFATEIGRIAAGIVPGPADQPLNPTLGAALCESCMPSFFAAIQYDTDERRHHTVLRIKSIAQRTGWGSAELIANGCETAWVKAAAAGRGPPYTRIARREQSDDPRLNGSWERLDPHALPDERDESDRRLVATRPHARLNWAIGIMGTEEDERIKVVGS